MKAIPETLRFYNANSTRLLLKYRYTPIKYRTILRVALTYDWVIDLRVYLMKAILETFRFL